MISKVTKISSMRSWFKLLTVGSAFFRSYSILVVSLLLKIGQARPLFVYFHSFHITNLTINYKSIDGVLWTQTRGGRTVGADESTELWRHP